VPASRIAKRLEEDAMNFETREKLAGVSVATLATALYKRGLRNQVIQGVHPVAPKGSNMVGPALTS
jgi:regulator of RNase E activity RraA